LAQCSISRNISGQLIIGCSVLKGCSGFTKSGHATPLAVLLPSIGTSNLDTVAIALM
jgi:hypothetical protein